MTLPKPGLYAITSAEICRSEVRLLAAVGDAIAGGIRLLQLRDKHNPVEIRERHARALLPLCRMARVPLIINDDIALAARVGADGVHLGLSDGSLAEARAALGPAAIIGVTCGASLARALAAEAGGASYVAFGAFFASQTKPEATPASLSLLTEARRQLRTPVCAIGGLTPDNGWPLVAAGAHYLAAIGGVFGASDIRAAAKAYGALFDP